MILLHPVCSIKSSAILWYAAYKASPFIKNFNWKSLVYTYITLCLQLAWVYIYRWRILDLFSYFLISVPIAAYMYLTGSSFCQAFRCSFKIIFFISSFLIACFSILYDWNIFQCMFVTYSGKLLINTCMQYMVSLNNLTQSYRLQNYCNINIYNLLTSGKYLV